MPCLFPGLTKPGMPNWKTCLGTAAVSNTELRGKRVSAVGREEWERKRVSAVGREKRSGSG